MMKPFLFFAPLGLAMACNSEKIPDEEITLDNCEGSSTSDVPEVYNSLFGLGLSFLLGLLDLIQKSRPNPNWYYLEVQN